MTADNPMPPQNQVFYPVYASSRKETRLTWIASFPDVETATRFRDVMHRAARRRRESVVYELGPRPVWR